MDTDNKIIIHSKLKIWYSWYIYVNSRKPEQNFNKCKINLIKSLYNASKYDKSLFHQHPNNVSSWYDVANVEITNRPIINCLDDFFFCKVLRLLKEQFDCQATCLKQYWPLHKKLGICYNQIINDIKQIVDEIPDEDMRSVQGQDLLVPKKR